MKEELIKYITAILFSGMCTAYYTSNDGSGLIEQFFNQNHIHLKYDKYASATAKMVKRRT